MKKVEVTEIEQQLNGRLLFSVRLLDRPGRMEFPIAIQDQGSAALNEIAVLQSTFGFASELAESARLGLE